MTAPVHPNEQDRLAALRRYGIVDTDAEPLFDDITKVIAAVCDAPVALISFVEQDRQWFKSEIGLGASETPRAVSICAHAILQRDLFVVPDTLTDERFASNPLVVGDPHLRFYAGAPIETSEGLPIGTLCVLDYKPRQLTDEQKEALRVLAKMVMTQLDLRRSDARNTEILESISEAFYTLDHGSRFTYVNRTAGALWQRRSEDLLGQVMWDVFPEAVGSPPYEAHRRAELEQRPVSMETMSSTTGMAIDLRIYPSPSGLSVFFRDITERKRLEKERADALAQNEVMLREVNHRVKNSLQLMSSMLRLQGRQIGDPEMRRQFDAASSRASAIALVHERLYRTAVVRRVEFGGYLRDLCSDLQRSLSDDRRQCRITVEADEVELATDRVIPLGLIVNELVINAVKYAYTDEKTDIVIAVTLSALPNGSASLRIADFGIGLPADFDLNAGTGLGMRLVNALTKQVDGTMTIEDRGGAQFTVTLPANAP